MAVEMPTRPERWQKDSSSSGERMEVDDEPKVMLSPNSRLREFKLRMKNAEATLPEWDQKDLEDPHTCADYALEIHSTLKREEMQFVATPGYMKDQRDINEKMRAILIDWLVEVHLKFKLVPETLYLTVNLIDRYLEKSNVMREKLQLVGVTAMLIASKYEEIYAPEVQDFVYITDRAYTKQEILECEYNMLKTLNFEITHCSSWKFLQRYQKVSASDDFILSMARYLLELSLVEYRMLKHSPSMLAAAALYLA